MTKLNDMTDAEYQQHLTNLGSHDLYVTKDVDAPDVIRDGNGEVVLGLCKRCGRAESELDVHCSTPKGLK